MATGTSVQNPGGTRLDRLITLLDTGSSSVTRLTAARQLAELFALRPTDLRPLLRRVEPLLRSKSWDTRVAAAEAVGAIAAHVRSSERQVQLQSQPQPGDSSLLRFDTFDLLRVLDNGTLLLASGGQEYDEVVDLSTPPQDRLAAARTQVQQRLGLGLGGCASAVDMRGLIEEGDLVPQGLSARQRAARKRKSRAPARTPSWRDGPAPKKAALPNKAEEEEEEEEGEEESGLWALAPLCRRLVLSITSPLWEVRHGALMGLREVLRCQSVRGEEAFLEDCVLRLLCVFALDRFGDYVGDAVVAPVREVCGQALGVGLRHLSPLLVERTVSCLLHLHARPEWEVRHGGLLGLKYCCALRPDLLPSLLPLLLPPTLEALRDKEDDVRTVAAQALAPAAATIVALRGGEEVAGVVVALWDVLLDLTDLSLTPSTTSVLLLLHDLYSQAHGVTPPLPPLPTLLPRLWPLLSHPLTPVRHAAVRLTLTLLTTPPQWTEEALEEARHCLFLRLAVEREEGVRRLLMDSWRILLADHSPHPPSPHHLHEWVCLARVPALPPPVRVAACCALGEGAARWEGTAALSPHLLPLLSSSKVLEVQVGAMVVADWFRNRPTTSSSSSSSIRGGGEEEAEVREVLAGVACGRHPFVFEEVQPLHVKLIQEGAAYWQGWEGSEDMPTTPEALALLAATGPATPLQDQLVATCMAVQEAEVRLRCTLLAHLACGLVWMAHLPPKLNPVLQPLMASVKREKAPAFQRRSAQAVAEVVVRCPGRASDKVVHNVCQLACTREGEGEGVGKRGAHMVFHALGVTLQQALFSTLPLLWQACAHSLPPAPPIPEPLLTQPPAWLTLPLPPIQAEPPAVVASLQLLGCLAAALPPACHPDLLRLLPPALACAPHPSEAVRQSLAACVSALAAASLPFLLPALLLHTLPLLRDATESARLGGAHLLAALLATVPATLTPFSPMLLLPLLACITDPCTAVREAASPTFAHLLPLLPLAQSMPPPPLLTPSQQVQAGDDARFLEQLLERRRVDEHCLAVPLNVELRRYQQEGINWLAFLQRTGLHGCLADDMGLGKTLQAAAMVASHAEGQRKRWEGGGPPPLPSLVVCPPTLVGQWADEVEKLFPPGALTPLQYHGTRAQREELRSLLPNHNLLLTSYEVLRADCDWLSSLTFSFAILDEGHVVKNGKSRAASAVKRIRAQHRLVLTGTPIQNKVGEVWALFDFLMPGFLGSEKEFGVRFGNPISASRDAKCSDKAAEAGVVALDSLHRQILPFMLRRTKEEVLKDLPPKIIQDHFCDLTPLQLRLYHTFEQSQAKTEVAHAINAYGGGEELPPSASKHVFQALQYLRRLCSHPLLVGGEEEGQDLHDLNHSPKLLALQQILLECGIGSGGSEAAGHRVLVFAQLKAFLDLIETELLQKHMPEVTYVRLDGGVEAASRMDVVRRFNADPTIDIMLLTTHVGGLGLNLTSADTVVFVEHDWNPMRDLQAMDRAHRLGQQRSVHVHRLIMRGTVEEKIMGLQRFKQHVAAMVVSSDNAQVEDMDAGKVLDLFTPPKMTLPPSTGEGSSSTSKGLKAVLAGLEELWDPSEYEREFDLKAMVAKLK